MNRLIALWHSRYLGLWFVLLINAMLLVEYIINPSNAKGVVLFFWIQSIILGIEHVLKLLFAKTGESMVVNHKLTTSTIGTNLFTAAFFTIHYGIFILSFGAIAIISKSVPGELFNVRWIFPAVVALLVVSVIELPGKLLQVHRKSPGIAKLMFMPYVRLLPFLLIFLNISNEAFWIFPAFLALKVVVEVVYFYFDDRPDRNLLT